jgi:hypothetical protein
MRVHPSFVGGGRSGGGGGGAAAAPRGGACCSRTALLLTAAAALAVGTVGYTLSTLSAARAAGALLDGGAAAGPGDAAPLLRRLRDGGGAPEPRAVGAADAAHAAHAAALRELGVKLDAVAGALADGLGALPARVAGAVAAAAPKVAAAAAPAAAAPAAPAAAATRAPARNLVLGMAKSIELPNLYRFVRSLRQHGGERVDIVIFTDDASGGHAWLYEAFGVRVELFKLGDFSAKVQKFHPSSYRWILKRDWMLAAAAAAAGGGPGSPPPYESVLFIDVRDSVFQRDPFAEIAGQPGFYAFMEAKPRTIAECGWNAGWVRGAWGTARRRADGAGAGEWLTRGPPVAPATTLARASYPGAPPPPSPPIVPCRLLR